MIEVRAPKATKTLCGLPFSAVLGKTSIDNPLSDSVFRPLFRIVQAMQATLPGSSVAEQVTVNHLVVGSIPTRAARSTRKPARVSHRQDPGACNAAVESLVGLLDQRKFQLGAVQVLALSDHGLFTHGQLEVTGPKVLATVGMRPAAGAGTIRLINRFPHA